MQHDWNLRCSRAAQLAFYPAALFGRCSPHSRLPSCSHHQRPLRSGSPGRSARVHGAQPIETKPLACKALIGTSWRRASAKTAFRLRPQLISFRKQPPGIERHHVDVDFAFANPMEDELAFDAEAVRKDDGTVDRAA